MSSPQKVLGGVIHVAIDHEFFVDVPGQKRVVADKRLRGKVGHPGGLHGRLPAAAGLAARLPGDGTADDHPFAGGGFVSDHGIRPGTTAPRADALPINSLVDNDLFAGLEDLRLRGRSSETAFRGCRSSRRTPAGPGRRHGRSSGSSFDRPRRETLSRRGASPYPLPRAAPRRRRKPLSPGPPVVAMLSCSFAVATSTHSESCCVLPLRLPVPRPHQTSTRAGFSRSLSSACRREMSSLAS